MISSSYSFGKIISCLEQEKIEVGKNPGKLVRHTNSNLKILFSQFFKAWESIYRGFRSLFSSLSSVPKINISGEHL